MSPQTRLEEVRAEWLAITRLPPPDEDRFAEIKGEANAIIDAGLWVSGPSDLLSVLGRQRDELTHSRILGWLLSPTGGHGLGRRFLRTLLDHVWPGEGLLQSGVVTVGIEVTRSAADEFGLSREARADVVLVGEDVTVVIENKLDAGEQVDQCERLYWAWADQPTEVRWLFLTPTGREPVTTSSAAARAAWRPMSYADVRRLIAAALADHTVRSGIGHSSAMQYLETLAGVG